MIALYACLVAIFVYNAPRVPSPIVDAAADLHEWLSQSAIEIDENVRPAGSMAVLDKTESAPSTIDTRFKKIIVIVMETMNEHTLREQVAALEGDTFLRKIAEHAHVYSRYYTSNQDSRTGMLGMLSSRFIPYDAYTEDGRDHYMGLGKKRSLADIFHTLGYDSAFAVSQTDVELVVGDFAWQSMLTLSHEEVDAAKPKYLCFNPYEFEHSCEDKLLLPKVVNFLVEHERAFVYQEMIWGHASEYNQASGKSNARYYSEYLDELLAALKSRGLLDQTLLVLTADHGFRDTAMQLDPEIYQIPLFFHAAGFQAQKLSGLYSHLDFKDLLLHELVSGSPAPKDNPFVFIVGPTGTSIRTVISRDGGFLAFKERGEKRYMLRLREPTQGAPIEPGAYLKLYDRYRHEFERAMTAPER